jgi:flavodoxin I/flavodoxin II
MTDILLVFGTDTGNTEEVAEKIQEQFSESGHVVEIIDVSDCSAGRISEAEACIFGIPTWDFGGIQGDWEDFKEELEAAELSGKKVALYGLGDQFGYGDFFIDAVGWLYEIIQPMGADIKGYWPVNGYEFTESRALSPCRTYFYGLAVDEDQQFEQSDERINAWVQQILVEFELEEMA